MPDLIFYNGKLHTQDLQIPLASALAVRDGRILAVGNDDDVRALANQHTRQIDLEGRRVLPGLTDAHIYFYEWALLLRGLALDDTTSMFWIKIYLKSPMNKSMPQRF